MKKNLSKTLAKGLEQSGLGSVEAGKLDDGSARYVTLRVNDTQLTFCFTPCGKKIERISLHQDVVEVVDEKQLWQVHSYNHEPACPVDLLPDFAHIA